MKRIKTCAHCATTFHRPRSSSPFCSRTCKIRATIKIDPATGCWNWTGNTTWVGYGQFCWKRYVAPAHRHAYLEFNGALEPDQVVKHKCDNKLCCNPAHLEAGSQRENVIEMQLRCPPKGSLDHNVVLAVFADKRKTSEVAAAFNISAPRVTAIRRGKAYCWLTGHDTRPRRSEEKIDSRRITFEGRTQSARAWSRELGVSDGTVLRRLNDGWCLEKTLTKAPHPGGRPRKVR